MVTSHDKGLEVHLFPCCVRVCARAHRANRWQHTPLRQRQTIKVCQRGRIPPAGAGCA